MLFSCQVMSDSFCSAMDCSPPGSSVHGISQARRLEWVAIWSSRVLPNPGIDLRLKQVSCIAGGVFTAEPLGSPYNLEERHEQKINKYTKN